MKGNFIHGVQELGDKRLSELYPVTGVFVWLFEDENYRKTIFEIICTLIMAQG